MADDKDDSQKTEEPTPKRLREAQEKGQVAKSQEVNHWFMIFGFALVVGLLGPMSMGGLIDSMVLFLERPETIVLSHDAGRRVLFDLMVDVALSLSVIMAVLIFLAAGSHLVQSGLIFSVESLKPQLSRLSPLEGLKRLFSSKALVDFAKGIAKLTLVGVTICAVLWPDRQKLVALTDAPPGAMLQAILDETVIILIAVLALLAVIAGLDFLFQKYKHTKDLMMTREEIKEEMKQTEGDPMVKSRLRQIRMERARQRMIAAVPDAAVVVTNPTHYAIALKYEDASMMAPTVVAKGVDHLAMRIREVASEHDIPIVENPPLARALYASVELEQEIPAQHYKAVAEVIAYVMRLKMRLAAGRSH